MIVIAPYARKLRNGSPNHPKDYPYWGELFPMIREPGSRPNTHLKLNA